MDIVHTKELIKKIRTKKKSIPNKSLQKSLLSIQGALRGESEISCIRITSLQWQQSGPMASEALWRIS